MSAPWTEDHRGFDPEFHEPPAKGPSPGPPASRLAVMSLVFGVAGFFLPLVGPVTAIVTGHVARSDIRAARGRLGGDSLARAGLALGYVWMALTLLVPLAIYVVVGRAIMAENGAVAVRRRGGPQYDFRAVPGVKLANEVTPSYALWLETRELIGPGEPIACAYEAESDPVSGVELAVVTPRHIHYVKGDRVTTINLADVSGISHGDDYEQKYDAGGHRDDGRYPIAVEGPSGAMMRILVRPPEEGRLFAQALIDAFEAARCPADIGDGLTTTGPEPPAPPSAPVAPSLR